MVIKCYIFYRLKYTLRQYLLTYCTWYFNRCPYYQCSNLLIVQGSSDYFVYKLNFVRILFLAEKKRFWRNISHSVCTFLFLISYLIRHTNYISLNYNVWNSSVSMIGFYYMENIWIACILTKNICIFFLKMKFY